MWEVCSNLSWCETKDKQFEDCEDALWAFRGEITKALGKDRKRLDYFLDLIDQYFAKTHKRKPLPIVFRKVSEGISLPYVFPLKGSLSAKGDFGILPF